MDASTSQLDVDDSHEFERELEQQLDASGSPDLEGEGEQGAGRQSSVNVSIPVPKTDIDALRNPLPQLAQMRLRLFDIAQPIELKFDEFERYWPYVDNVWVRQHRAGADKSGRTSTDYYACRLQRPTYAPRKSESRPDGKPLRKKQTREGGTCQMRIKTIRYDAGLQKITIMRVGEHNHSHDLDHIDKIKRNTVVMDIARAEVMKGFMPASVYTVLNDYQVPLAAAGGGHLNRNDVRNASQAWRQIHKQPLAVHPGYKYDHGNGIVRDGEGDPNSSSGNSNNNNNSNIESPFAPVSGTQPGQVAPRTGPIPMASSSSTPMLPPDTLYYPPQSRAFLNQYLPNPTSACYANNLPHITLSYATSMDSFLSIAPHTSTTLSNPATKSMTHYLRSMHDAILVGVGTALTDNPTLNCRLAGAGGYGGLGWDHQPRPVIIDPGARLLITPQSNMIKAAAEGKGRAPWVIIAPGYAMDPQRLELLKHYGGKYLGLPDMDKRFRLKWEAIFRALWAEGVRSIMVEGGGMVINELLQPENSSLISSVIVTVAPTYLGTGGVVVCPTKVTDASGVPRPVVRFRDVTWQSFGEDAVMCGKMPGPAVHPPHPQNIQPGMPPSGQASQITVPSRGHGGGIINGSATLHGGLLDGMAEGASTFDNAEQSHLDFGPHPT